MKLLTLALAVIISFGTAIAEKLEVDLKAGEETVVSIHAALDDSNLQDPPGYADRGERSGHFQKTVSLENTGKEPLVGVLIVNRRDWQNGEGLLSQFQDSVDDDTLARQLYGFWINNRFHAMNASKLAREPMAALHFWGFTLCGEDTFALAHLFHAKKIKARAVHLNGHVAAEYEYKDVWHLVDGDQNTVYLGLDNHTLMNASSIRKDPFLALRTKVFGKHAAYHFTHSAYNTSLLEFVAPVDPNPITFKAVPAPLNTFALNPGEALVWHADKPPDRVVGLGFEVDDHPARTTLCTLEYRFSPKDRERKKDKVTLTTAFPIVKATNAATGWSFNAKQNEAVFEVEVPVKSDDDQISVFCQCSRLALPAFGKGDNTVLLKSESEGKARLTLEYDAHKEKTLPVVILQSPAKSFIGAPHFTLKHPEGTEKVWWQISEERDFRFVSPNFDNVIAAATEVKIDPVSSTFLSPGDTYFFRVKVRCKGVWGEWCEPWEFQSTKPAQPLDLVFQRAPDGGVRLTWKGGDAGEYLVFGSNRLDFMPEIFTQEEITGLNHLKITGSRKNQNLLATTKVKSWDFKPRHRYYRVIAKDGVALSVPSPMETLGKEFIEILPPPTILQMRSTQTKGEDGLIIDEYIASEEKLPIH